MSEFRNKSCNIDQDHVEVERVYRPRHEHVLERFRGEVAKRIVQPYLSDPSEPFSLRLRQTEKGEAIKYNTTLKSTGVMTNDGLSRSEYESDVTNNVFRYYTADTLPTVRKNRVSPIDNIDIDFFEDGNDHVESENPASWRQFLDQFGLSDGDFEDMTGRIPDNETRAHDLYRRRYGRDAFAPYREFDTHSATEAILRYVNGNQLSSHRTPVVRLYGRSGSGKSHYLEIIREQLVDQHIPSIVLSTDNYNIGTTALTKLNGGEYPTNFDEAAVYDIAAAQRDIKQLLDGKQVKQRQFDFTTSEPTHGGDIAVPQGGVLFVEGLWARHEAFDFADHTIEVDTPLATSLGRRVMRDLQLRPEFADPSKNLTYYLEHAEPAYRTDS